MLNEQLDQVESFHRAIGESVSERPRLLSSNGDSDSFLAEQLRQITATAGGRSANRSQLSRRALMAIEELAEWIEAHVEGDLEAAADALGDRLYVLLGDAVATGLPVRAIFEEVHRSNMTKLSRNAATGKGTKRNGFEPPQLREILQDGQNDKG